MQKFDTPAPISAVLDIPAGWVRFVAADRADTTVEVLPANASKRLDVKAAEQIQACIDAKVFPATVRPMAALRVLTMGLLGVAVMHLGDRLSPLENADDLARDVLDVLIAGLRSGTVLRSSGPPLQCPEIEAKTEIAAKS